MKKMYQPLRLILLLGCISLLLPANLIWAAQQQTMTLRGKVITVDNEPVPGASVTVKGTDRGTSTDGMGVFVLEGVPGNASVMLEVSFIGMKTYEGLASPDRENIIRLQEDATELEEVVVTGYGNFTRSSYTGAASVLNTDKLQDLPVISVAQMLESTVPGLRMSSTNSGQPGSFQSFRIRGMGSINASNEPLFVLDGVPLLSGNISNDDNSAGGLSVIASLNPSDIENITVLKDAASTSLYGARGSNGVILITTRKGKEGKTSYSFKANYGVSDLAYTFRDIMGGAERRELAYEGLVNSRLDRGMAIEQARQWADGEIDKYAPVPESGYSDWKKAMFHKGHQQNYEFSANGGSSANNFAASLGYTKQTGVSLNSGFERFSGRINYNNKYKNFDFSANSMFSITENKMTPEGAYWASAMYTSRVTLTPSIPIYNPDGTYNTSFSQNGGFNPLNEQANSHYYTRFTRSLSSLVAGYTFIEGLRLSTTLNADYNVTKEFRYWGPGSGDGKEGNGRARMGMYERLRLNSNTMINYIRSFDKHNFNAAVVYEIQQTNYEGLIGEGKGYGQQLNYTLTNAAEPTGVSQPKTKDAMLSYVGRLNYDYDHRYYFAATFRRDGSSRLAKDARWDNFWSVSGSWRVTAENFMQPVRNWLTDLKLKASYGVNGNLPSNLYDYMGTYSTRYVYGSLSAIREYTIPNENLKWERGYMLNVGLEASFINRIFLTVDVYKKDTKDLLMSRPLNNISGFSSVTSNVGHLRNTGVEIEVRSVNINNKDFSWSTSLNMSHNQNKIIRLSDLPKYDQGRYWREEGKPWGTIYLREWAGVDPETGDGTYYINKEDANGNRSREITNVPEDAAYIPIKDVNPTLMGGLQNSFRYKFIDLSFNLSFTLGGWSYDGYMYQLSDDGYQLDTNKSVEMRKRWKKPGDKTSVPRYVLGNSNGGYYNSTRGLHSTDHLRLKSLILGFNLPKQWTSAIGLSNARIYFSGNNLLTWAVYDQYDPEYNDVVNMGVPPLKTYAFGLEISF